MKNQAINDMMRHQYGWDHRDVTVEFLHSISNEYTFKVTHDHPYDDKPTIIKRVTVKVDDFVEGM
jgi:hypothetical protein